MPSRLSKKQVIQKFRKIHGGKYDYSKIEYFNLNSKVCIICPEHGEFWQSPHKHIYRKQGCPKCGINKRAKKRASNLKEFITLSKKIHPNKYDYSKVIYENRRKKVCIICPEHGEFWQNPEHHLKGSGCPSCSGNKKFDLDIFIETSNKKHNNKYGYIKSNYKNSHSIVTITCPKHGDFTQSAYHHLYGNGCPICVGSNYQNELNNFITSLNLKTTQRD